MSASGKFFAIGKPQWQVACNLGVNCATSFLVLALGSGRDHSTTSWSAKSIETRAGMGWRRARESIDKLIEGKILVSNGQASRPRYKIAVPSAEELIWLPNELVIGAGNEVPPVARLKQVRDIELLRMFIALYGEQDLPGDGGLPRSLIRDEYEREQIATHGQFVFWGFRLKTGNAWHNGPFDSKKIPRGELWPKIRALQDLGLLTTAIYLAESADDDADLLHALSGDQAAEAAYDAGWNAIYGKEGYAPHKSEGFDRVAPVLAHLKNVAMVGVYRLHYRPKTARTSAWYAQHVEQCRRFEELYRSIFGAVEVPKCA